MKATPKNIHQNFSLIEFEVLTQFLGLTPSDLSSPVTDFDLILTVCLKSVFLLFKWGMLLWSCHQEYLNEGEKNHTIIQISIKHGILCKSFMWGLIFKKCCKYSKVFIAR